MIRKMIAIDWRAMKVYRMLLLLLPFLAFFLGWFTPWTLIPVFVFTCHNFSLNTFAVEEKGALNNLYLTLPIKRRTIVKGRFFLSLIIVACGMIMGIFLMPLANELSRVILRSVWHAGTNGNIAILAFSFLLYSIFNIFTLPMLFKLGYTKGKFLGFHLPAILFGMAFGAYFTITRLPGNELLQLRLLSFAIENMLIICGGMVALGIVLLYLSYALSVRVYSKRDF